MTRRFSAGSAISPDDQGTDAYAERINRDIEKASIAQLAARLLG